MSAFDKLNPQQEKFIRHYYLNGHVTKAAKFAGYSEKTAYSIGSNLLKKVEIIAALQELEDATKNRYKALEHKIVGELESIAFFDLTQCMEVNKNGEVVFKSDFTKLPVRIRRALSSYTENTSQFGDSKTFKAHDKMRALDMLGKHIGMWKEKEKDAGSDSGDGSNRETVTQRVNRLFGEYKKRRGSKSGGDSEGSNGP